MIKKSIFLLLLLRLKKIIIHNKIWLFSSNHNIIKVAKSVHNVFSKLKLKLKWYKYPNFINKIYI